MGGSCPPPLSSLPSADSLSVTLPFGFTLQSMSDLSKPPTDCALVHSLMLQLMPALGSLQCLLNLMQLIQKAAEIPKALSPPTPASPVQLVQKIIDLIPAIEKVVPCFPTPIQVAFTVKGILKLILAWLHCFITTAESVLTFQAGIDLNSAQGNPALLASLNCAQSNANSSLTSLSAALALLEPLLNAVEPLLKLANLSVTLPSLTDVKAAADLESALQKLDQTIAQLQQVVDAIPG